MGEKFTSLRKCFRNKDTCMYFYNFFYLKNKGFIDLVDILSFTTSVFNPGK